MDNSDDSGSGSDDSIIFEEGKTAKSAGYEILINGLTKKTDNETLLSDITLGIAKNQCFGFIGAEGSGQSTLLRIVAGLTYPTSGDISIEETSLVKNYEKYISEVSYCPKEHMLMDELTGRETLMLVGTVKGVGVTRLKELIGNLAERLVLEKILDKLIMTYDLGARRKLSFAITLLGNPRILVLEEPFHEVDPDSCDQINNVLLQEKGYVTIILSSTNTELSANFCDRIGMLIDGKLTCVGSPEFLTNNYSMGIAIIIQLVPENGSFYSQKGVIYRYEDPGSEEIEDDDDEDDEVDQNFILDVEGQRRGKLEKNYRNVRSLQTKARRKSDDAPKYPRRISKAEGEKITVNSLGDTQGKYIELKTPQAPTFTGTIPMLMVSSPEEVEEELNRGMNKRSSGLSSHTSDTSNDTDSSDSSSDTDDSEYSDNELWEQELAPIMDYIDDNFPGAELLDKFPCFLHYHIDAKDIDLGDIFRKMEIARIAFELESYRVGTGTLNQLLATYTRGQTVKKEAKV